MLTTNFTSGAKKFMVAALFASAFVSNANIVSASLDDGSLGICSFTRQLEDPYEKVVFQNRVAVARQASTSLYGEMPGDNNRVIVNGGERLEIDAFSFDCISCHDGTSAPSHETLFKNTNQSDGDAAQRVLSSHPIGMHYGNASYINNQLRSVNSLNPNMLFVDGKVGCLSCHNPLNPERNHLVTSNEHSNLCFSCHIK